ncbi:MAG TPA: cytidine deaminase [Acidobacteriaceae bacterium]|jgi:cytidine deaminase|nr:cytidine deaminase [Acidobacteriaceae bacterium]
MDFTKLSRDDVGRLAQAATAAAANAYAPYSHFRVGCGLLLSNDEVVSGANFENASYGLTICAERAAVAQAITVYGPNIRIGAIYIVNWNEAASAPCGACRQVLWEFAAPTAQVFFPTERGLEQQPLSALLPFGFQLRL